MERNLMVAMNLVVPPEQTTPRGHKSGANSRLNRCTKRRLSRMQEAECKPQDKKKDASHKTAALSLLSFGFLMMYLLKQWQALPPHWGQVCHLLGCPQWEGLANPLLQPPLQGQWPQQAKDGILQFSNFMLCFLSFWLWTLCDNQQTIVTLTNNLTL